MAQVSCSLRQLNRYWKQGCPVFLLVELAERCVGFGGHRGGRSKACAWGGWDAVAIWLGRMYRNSRGREEWCWPGEAFLNHFWWIVLQAWVMNRDLKLPFGLLLFMWVVLWFLPCLRLAFLQSQVHFPSDPCPSPAPLDEDTGLALTKHNLETSISPFRSLWCFQNTILILLGGRKELGWGPCKAIVFLGLAKVQQLQLLSEPPQRMSMYLITFQWQKKLEKPPSQPLGYVLLQPICSAHTKSWRSEGILEA